MPTPWDPFPLLTHLAYDCMKALQSLFPVELSWCPQVEFNSFSWISPSKRVHTIKKDCLVSKLLFSADLSAGGARPREQQCSEVGSVGARQGPDPQRLHDLDKKIKPLCASAFLSAKRNNKTTYLFGVLWALNELIQAKCLKQGLAQSSF